MNILRLFDMRDEIVNSGILSSHLIEAWARDKVSRNKLRSNLECNFYESAEDVPDSRELTPTDKNLMIFDDLLLEKQNKCECYIRGRHSNVDCFYLSQNYFKLPRQTIRENANFICLFPQDLKNINHIYYINIESGLTKRKNLC